MRKPITRRSFLKASSAAVFVGFDPSTRSWISRAHATPPAWAQLPSLDGSLLRDEGTLAAMSTDRGESIFRVPAAVLRPRSLRDIVEIVRFANAHRLKVAARGQAHSQYGQTLAQGGIVVDAGTLNAVKLTRDETAVDAQGGATWNDVIRVTLGRGLVPPALGNTMTLSVGGILSAGGWSNSSHLYGSVADSVEELDVVTGGGRLITCSRQREPELFDMVLAGMGQCGIIASARMKLVPAPEFVTRRRYIYADLKTLLADGARLSTSATAEHLSSNVARQAGGKWTFELEIGKFHRRSLPPAWDALEADLRFQSRGDEVATSFAEYLQRQAASNAAAREARRKNPRQSAFIAMFLPGSAAEGFIAQILASPDETFGAPALLPSLFDTRKFARPMFKLPAGDVVLVLWMFRTVLKGDATGFAKIMDTNRAMLERMRAAGGKAYPPYAAYFTPAEWQAHYGADTWRRLLAAKKAFDPGAILGPGAGLFGTV